MTCPARPRRGAWRAGQSGPAAQPTCPAHAGPATQPACSAQAGPAAQPTTGQPTTGQASAATPPTSHAGPAGEAARGAEAARAAAEGQPGWLTGRAAQGYACDAAITPIVTGTVDQAALAALAAELLAGLAEGCACDRGAAGGQDGITATVTTGTSAAAATPAHPAAPEPSAIRDPRAAPHPTALARLHEILLRHAADLLSGPGGLAAFLRSHLIGDQFPAVSLPLDTGTPTSLITGGLRRAVITRDRHCAFPGCDIPPNACQVHHIKERANGGQT